jgi:hypothetical protein
MEMKIKLLKPRALMIQLSVLALLLVLSLFFRTIGREHPSSTWPLARIFTELAVAIWGFGSVVWNVRYLESSGGKNGNPNEPSSP